MTGGRMAGLVVVGLLVAWLGSSYGYIRVLVGSVVFLALLSFGFKYWRDVGLIPPEPTTEDVRSQNLRYICTVCGLELRIEVAARDKAPTHCGEAMKLIAGTERSPLQPG